VTHPFIASKRLPVPHGFGTRHGEVPDFARELSLDRARLYTVTQVHGDAVAKAPVAKEVDADGVWAQGDGEWVAIKTADCVPLLIADPVGKRVAAVHSGWRGTDKRIAARAVDALVREGSKAKDLFVAVGPAIQICCYEVSEDLAQRFSAQFGADVLSRETGKPHLDLARAVRRTLTDAGVPIDQIDLLANCTRCERERFHSHRRDPTLGGRQLSFIACRFQPPAGADAPSPPRRA
jgi:polyphenol oxidase